LLAPNAVLTLRLPLAAEGPAPRAPIAFAVEWAEGDDLAATGTAYIAAGVPDAIRNQPLGWSSQPAGHISCDRQAVRDTIHAPCRPSV
jgi:hypothetical protein